jgi:hypothetical protein
MACLFPLERSFDYMYYEHYHIVCILSCCTNHNWCLEQNHSKRSSWKKNYIWYLLNLKLKKLSQPLVFYKCTRQSVFFICKALLFFFGLYFDPSLGDRNRTWCCNDVAGRVTYTIRKVLSNLSELLLWIGSYSPIYPSSLSKCPSLSLSLQHCP